MKQKSFAIKTSASKDLKSIDINLDGDLGIRNAAAIRKSLMAIDFQAGEATFRLHNIEKIDITTIQTFVAVSKQLRDKGIKIYSVSEFPPEISELLKNTGFTSTF